MKNVIVFYGYGETPQSFWYPWLKSELLKKGFQVSIPSYQIQMIQNLQNNWISR
ncbi:MAG: hypothetical protein WD988_02640 [Candidatus Curtissbacteria bacterium]